MTESIWFTDSLVRIHISPEQTDVGLLRGAPRHGQTILGPPGALPADVMAKA